MHYPFADFDWERHARTWEAWWAGELERPLLVMYGSATPAIPLPPRHIFIANYGLDFPVDDMLDILGAHLACRRWHGDAWPKWEPTFGPGIVAGFLGARVRPVQETVWFDPADGTGAIADLHPAYDDDNAWWRHVQTVTRKAIERWGGQVSVATTDLGGNLDILASLRTSEQLLFDVLDEPEQVARLAGEITRLWLRYYDGLHAIIGPEGRGTTPWAPVWSPGRTYMLQCDFSYMISPEMFERFVLPDLAACCAALDHGFYHLDGKGQIPHLDLLLSLDDLRGIQWIPGDGAPPAEEWLPLLKRIRDGGKLCQLYVSPEGARTIARELGGKGFCFEIMGRFTQEEAEAFMGLPEFGG